MLHLNLLLHLRNFFSAREICPRSSDSIEWRIIGGDACTVVCAAESRGGERKKGGEFFKLRNNK